MSVAELLRYLLLPLRLASLLLIVIFSVLLVLAATAGFFGIPLALILVSWTSKYGFVLLDHVADGEKEPPALSVEMVNPASEQRPLLFLLLVIFLFSVAEIAERWFGRGAYVATAALIAVFLPSIVAVQGATGSFVEALNPRTFVGLILRLRGDYVLILAAIAALVAFGRFVVWVAADTLPLVVSIALVLYAWLAMFSVIGGVLFERRLDIGLEARHTPERDSAKVEADVDRIRSRQLDAIYAEWRGGAQANAWTTIQKQVDRSDDATTEWRWLYQRTAPWPDARLASRIARELLPRLLAQHAHGEALDVVRERLRRDARFRPVRSADLVTLVHLARDAGDRPTARLLLQEFRELYPNDPAQAVVDQLAQQLAR
jgi:hypothetical protein